MAKRKPKSIITHKCSRCGTQTKHYLTKEGDYKCLICGTTNKKAPKIVLFEQDEELESALND